MHRNAHIVTEDGHTFAATIDGDGYIVRAIEVEEVAPDLLDAQVERAETEGVEPWDLDRLTYMLAHGGAQIISSYMEVTVP